MVLESVVADLLNHLLCKYVENVNETQVRVGIWGGDVKLENLKLRQDALDELDLPIKATFAHLGQLVLKIPWKNLFMAPWIISLERLFLLAVPNRDIRYDPAKEELWAQNAKDYKLQKIEEIKRQVRQKDESKMDNTFAEKLVAQVIKNIQIKISDIHIRYEDRMTNSKKPFTLGVTLSHFHVYSTNKFWVQTVFEENVAQVNKLVNIQSFAIYWNCNSQLFSQKFLEKNLPVLPEFQRTICSNNHLPAGFSYVLEPIHATIRMFIHTKPELDNYTIPKFDVDIEMETVALCLDKLQYCDIIRLMESFNRMTLSARYRKYRPYLNRYRGHYKTWWKFAYTCILEEDIRRVRRNWDWNNMKQHLQQRHQYARAYRTMLITEKPTVSLITEVKGLEKNMDVLNIILVRELVEMQVESRGGVLQSKKKISKGWGKWIKSFFFRSSHDQMEVEESRKLFTALGNAMTPKEKEKLYKAIGYQEYAGPTVYPLSYIAVLVQFNLSTLQLVLKDKSIVTYNVIHLAFTKVSMNLEQRPTRNGLKINANIFRFFVHGLKQSNIVPLLVVSKNVSNKENLLDIFFELNPLHSPCDQRLIVFLRSLQIVYDARTTQKISDIFQGPMDYDTMHKLQAQLENVKERSATGLQHVIEQHAALELKLDIKAPYIIIPHGGFYTCNEDILVVNLGRLAITSFPRNPANRNVRSMFKKGISEETIFKTMVSQSYDKFFLNLENIQVLIVLQGENWLEVLERNEITPLHLLEPLCFIVILNTCLIKDDPKLPKIKLTISIKNIAINLTNLRLVHLCSILSSIPAVTEHEEKKGQKVKFMSQDSVPQLATNYLINAYLETKVERTKKDKIIKEKHVQDFKNKIQAIMCDTSFELECILVKVFLVKSAAISFETTKQFLILTLLKIEADAIQKTFDLHVTARLGGISLDVFDLNRVVRLLNTPMTDNDIENNANEYLFILNYYQLDRNAPEFIMKENVCLRQLKIGFSFLKMTFHQEILLSFVDVIRNFQFQLAKVTKHSNEVREPKETVKHRFRDAQEKVVGHIRERKVEAKLKEELIETDKSAEEISLDFKANIKQIEIVVETRTSPIVNVQIGGCLIIMISCTSFNKLGLQIKKMQVFDCCSKSIHYEIVTMLDDDTFNTEIVMYNKSQLFSHEKADTPDMSVMAKIACLRIIYLYRFFSSLLVFYSNIEVVLSLFFVTSSEEQSDIKESTLPILCDPTFAQLNIKMEAPIIILPLNSLSMEAVMVHLGSLTVGNNRLFLSSVNANNVSASLDCIKIKLGNIKANRVYLNYDYQVINSITIIDPLDIEVEIERNLALWYKSVPDVKVLTKIPCLKVFCTEEDYKMLMKLLYQNFSEMPDVSLNKTDTFKMADRFEDAIDDAKRLESINFDESYSSDKVPEALPIPERIMQKINIIFDGLVLKIYTGGAVTLDTQAVVSKKDFLHISLLSFHLGFVALPNGSERLELSLQNCILDDMRGKWSDSENSQYVRLMQLTETVIYLNEECQQNTQSSDAHESNLIKVTYLRNIDDTSVEVFIQTFQLMLCLEYLVELNNIFMRYIPDSKAVHNLKQDTSLHETKYSMRELKEKSVVKLQKSLQRNSVKIIISKPNIIIVENFDNLCNNAFVLEGDIIFKMQYTGSKTAISAYIENFQLNLSCIKPNDQLNSTVIVLQPCTMSCIGFTGGQGDLHLEISLSDIRISLSSIIIDLLYKINTTVQSCIYGDSVPNNQHVDYSDIWTPKRIRESEFSFLNEKSIEKTLPTQKSFTMENLCMKEMCMISAPSVIITVESGYTKNREPIIRLEAELEAVAYDWSSSLYICNNLSLQIAYYNTVLALWEPLLEPVEHDRGGKYTYRPWHLEIILQMNKDISTSNTEFANDHGENITQSAAFHVAISSKEKAEFTLTKTGIDVLLRLSTIISDVDINPTYEGAASPYVVRNMSGIPITLILHEGPFKILNVHDATHHEVTIDSGKQIELIFQGKNEETTNIYKERPPSSSLCIENQCTKKTFLNISVRINARLCILAIPTFRADKRYFSLKFLDENGDQWGIVSDVNISSESTLINLRSIIKIKNHINAPIEVYCNQNVGEGSVYCGTVESDNELILPLHCIYTATKEIMFCTNGYKLSESFIWKKLHKARVISKLLHCPPLDSKQGESLFINVVGYSSSLTFENTSYFTPESIAYIIHLHPAVTLKNLLPVNVVTFLENFRHQNSKVIKAGDQLQMINVKPGQAKIFLAIPSYCQQRWSSKGYIDWSSQFSVVQFTSEGPNKENALELQLLKDDVDGIICFQIYSPFWMLNKTGFSLYYRQFDNQINICYHDYDVKEPMMFSYLGKANAKNTVSIKISGGQWSDKFSLDAAGSSGIVNCKVGEVVYQIGVKIQLSNSKLTKHVIFEPFYVLVNNHEITVKFQEVDRPDDLWIRLKPGECLPFWPRALETISTQNKLQVCFENSSKVSSPFLYSVVQSTLLEMDTYGGVFVDVHKVEAAVYITFLPYKPGLAPALLVNHTDQPIYFYERDQETKILNSQEVIMFAWNEPTEASKITFKVEHYMVFSDTLRNDCFKELKCKSKTSIYWISFLEGFQRVNLFTTSKNVALSAQMSCKLEPVDMEITVSLHHVGISLVNNITMKELMYVNILSSSATRETNISQRKQFKPLSASKNQILEEAMINLKFERSIGRPPKEVINIGSNFQANLETKQVMRPTERFVPRSSEGIWFVMKTSQHQSTMHGKLNKVQIDNQLLDRVFPVMFAPEPLPRTVRASLEKKPFAEFLVIRRYMEHNPVKHYKHFKVLIQEFNVKLDINTLYEIFEFLNWGELSEYDKALQFKQELKIATEPLLTSIYKSALMEEKSFYELFHLSPLKLHLSFSLNSEDEQVSNSAKHNFFLIFLHDIGVTLTDIDNVVMKLNYFEQKNTFSTYNQMYSRVYSHYVNEFLKNAYAVILGLNLFGNPWGLLRGLGKGVQDLFYEPYLGAVQGPQEFGHGVMLGVVSLVGSAVGGMCGAVSRISATVGTGIAVLAFDRDFQRGRKEKKSREPLGARRRVVRGGKRLVFGIVDGVFGVLTQPVRGARRGGVAGFFKGVGRGVAGLVTKPVVGVCDFVSESLAVIVPVETHMSGAATHPLRPPRFLRGDGLVRPYSRVEAEGNLLLHELDKGRFLTTDRYTYLLASFNDTKDRVLLTDKRIMYIQDDTILGVVVAWDYTWDVIESANANNEGVSFIAKQVHRKIGISRRSQRGGELIPIKKRKQRNAFEAVVKKHLELYRAGIAPF